MVDFFLPFLGTQDMLADVSLTVEEDEPVGEVAPLPFIFVFSSILGDTQLWVGPRLEHLLSS